jgi:hypothetical protein
MTEFTQFWRRWLPGPKHGLARGVGVWGSPGFRKDGRGLADLLADCRTLRRWAAVHSVNLDNGPASLVALDEALDLADDKRATTDLANDAGCYLGTVLVQHDDLARWKVWPNEHPVVRLASGRDVDVGGIVNDAARTGKLGLAKLYEDASG